MGKKGVYTAKRGLDQATDGELLTKLISRFIRRRRLQGQDSSAVILTVRFRRSSENSKRWGDPLCWPYTICEMVSRLMLLATNNVEPKVKRNKTRTHHCAYPYDHDKFAVGFAKSLW